MCFAYGVAQVNALLVRTLGAPKGDSWNDHGRLREVIGRDALVAHGGVGGILVARVGVLLRPAGIGVDLHGGIKGVHSLLHTWEDMAIAANDELRRARTRRQLAHVDGPTRLLPVTQVLRPK